MASVPKRVGERFVKGVSRFQKILRIAKDRDVNESDTVAVLNDIFADVLGYDKYVDITSEFSIRGTYCDLAVKIDDKVQYLIEAKAVGIELKDSHVKQAIDYGANHGLQWVVLTNGVDWRVYRIRFEKPINFDLVCSFDFLSINPRDERDQELLFILSKEGVNKNVREDFYDRVQSVNRFVIGNLILSDPVVAEIRRELRKLAGGMKIDIAEVEQIVRAEVLKREIVDGEEAEAAKVKVDKFYKKAATSKRKKKVVEPSPERPNESVSERLLREAEEDEKSDPAL